MVGRISERKRERRRGRLRVTDAVSCTRIRCVNEVHGG